MIVMEDVVETEHMKVCPAWCWIGHKYTTEKPEGYKEPVKDAMQTIYSDVSKADILDMVAGLTEQIEILKGGVK